jgi:hypothetical protein
MAVGLAATAIGLGARMADYHEDNPGKLTAGYGGTVNLLASLLFVAGMLCCAAIPLGWTYGLRGFYLGQGAALLWAGMWTVYGLRLAHTWFGQTHVASRR